MPDLLDDLKARRYAEILESTSPEPTRFGPAFARGLALVMSDRGAEALTLAEAIAPRLQSRHPCVLAAQALAQSADLEGAVTWAIRGLHRRLWTDVPALSIDTPGLARLDAAEASVVHFVGSALVQHGMQRMRDAGLVETDVKLLTGLTAPTLQQAYQILKDCRDLGGPSTPFAQAGLYCGLARCERWYDDFQDARDALEQALKHGPAPADSPAFLAAEAAAVERDQRLISATRVELRGFGATFVLFRTQTAIGGEYTEHGATLSEQITSDSTPEKIAIEFKDELVELIGSGFEFTVLSPEAAATDQDERQPETTDPSPQLATLLDGPLDWTRWQAIVALLESWPEGAARDEARATVDEALDALPSAKASKRIVGLWRLVSATYSTGELDYEGADFDDIDDLKRRSEIAPEWKAEGGEGLTTLLEIHPDGRFREVDLSRYPVRRVLEPEYGAEDPTPRSEPTDTPIGMVSRQLGLSSSYEARDVHGFNQAHHSGRLTRRSSAVLCYDRPDQVVHDAVEGVKAQLHRCAWHMQDGLYISQYDLVYRRVALAD